MLKELLKFAQINESGDVEIEEIKKLITNKTKMIAITHISNVTGAVLPITKIVDLAKEKNIPVLIDGTQGVPYSKIDMQKIDVIFMQYPVIKCTDQTVLVYCI